MNVALFGQILQHFRVVVGKQQHLPNRKGVVLRKKQLFALVALEALFPLGHNVFEEVCGNALNGWERVTDFGSHKPVNVYEQNQLGATHL